MQELWNAVKPDLFALLATLLGAAVVFAKSGLKKLIDAHIESATTKSALLYLNDSVFSVVAAAQQTTVAELKKAFADGKLTEQELKDGLAAIKKAATDEVLALTWGRIQSALGLASKDEARSLIATKVEAAVPAAKSLVASPLARAPSA